MNRIFRPGQLVQVNPDYVSPDTTLELLSEPGLSIKRKITGRLRNFDVGIIITVEATLSAHVYVVGTEGAGWTPSGVLKILQGSLGSLS